METEHHIRFDGEHRDVRAHIELTVLRVHTEDELLDCSIAINTNDWSFSSLLTFSLASLETFRKEMQRLVETNEGIATLGNYTEESEIKLSVVNRASGKIVIEGSLARLAPTIDERLYRKPAKLAGHAPAGSVLNFGGFETDQSFLHSPLESLARILSQYSPAKP